MGFNPSDLDEKIDLFYQSETASTNSLRSSDIPNAREDLPAIFPIPIDTDPADSFSAAPALSSSANQ